MMYSGRAGHVQMRSLKMKGGSVPSYLPEETKAWFKTLHFAV